MSALFGNIEKAADIQQETDFVGGPSLLESDVYEWTIQYAYGTVARSGAQGLAVAFKNNDGYEFRDTFYLTSGTAKGGKNYWVDRNGDKHFLPGFNQAEALAQLTVGKSITELAAEEKTIALYNFEAKAEVPTKVNMLMDLVGQKIAGGIQKQLINRTIQHPETKNYLNTSETREVNVMDKLFRITDGLTVAEVRAGATEPKFLTTWKEKNKGKVNDRVKPADAGADELLASSTGRTATTSTAATEAAPTQSLFG